MERVQVYRKVGETNVSVFSFFSVSTGRERGRRPLLDCQTPALGDGGWSSDGPLETLIGVCGCGGGGRECSEGVI